MDTQRTWPYGDNVKDDGNIVVNQRMIHQLLNRKGTPENRSMMALGIEVEELRDEVGMGLAELACLSGLDRGFLAILEAGKAVESEVTDGVLMDLAIALSHVCTSEGRDVWTIREYLEEAMRP